MRKNDLIEVATRLGVSVKRKWTVQKIREYLSQHLLRTIQEIRQIIAHHERHSTSYFWSPPTSASSRRQIEKERNFTHCYLYDGKTYRYESVVNCSCKNFYYTGTFDVDGKHKDLRLFRKLLKSFEKEVAHV